MAPATSATMAPAQEAGRPQPQTTIEPPGGPFILHSQKGRKAQYDVSAQAFGALISQPLTAIPGYVAAYRIRHVASGGVGTGQTTTTSADAPFNVYSQVTLRDAFGTPLIVGPGWEMLKALPKYSGQFGLHALSDPINLPSYSALVTGAGASGNFTFSSILPLEFAKGIGVISGANASLLPSLQLQLASAATVYGTQVPATTLPTNAVNVEADHYWLPEGSDILPMGLGTTCQWVLQQATPTVGSASTTTVNLPRLGGYLTTIILVLRDSTGARIDSFPTRFRLYLDGVPIIDTLQATFLDDMQIAYAGTGSGSASNAQWARDTGVLAFTRKTSLAQESLGLMDTGNTFLSTNPGTLISFEGSPWASITNAPATLSAIVGQVVPAGSLVQGSPEL